MPSSYTGVAANITAGAKPSTNLPIDADTPNAASVTTPFQKIIDFEEYLLEQIAAQQASNWVPRQTATITKVVALGYNGALWVAAFYDGTNSKFYSSPDLVTWTVRTTIAAVSINTGSFVWSSSLGIWVFCCDATAASFWSSPDGLTWTLRTSPGGTGTDVCWTGTRFHSVGDNGGVPTIGTSTDGINWGTNTAIPAGALTSQSRITSGGGVVVVAPRSIATTTQIYTSPDGAVLAWTGRTWLSSTQVTGVDYGNAQFVATDGTRIGTSPDGATWTQRTAGLSGLGSAPTARVRVLWNGRQYLVVGGTSIWSSPDSLTWKKRVGAKSPTAAYLAAAADATNCAFAIGGDDGFAQASMYAPLT